MSRTIASCCLFVTIAQADFDPFPPTPKGQPYSNEVAHEALSTYATIAWESYSDSIREVVGFNMALYAFRKSPSEEGFQTAKEKWISARKAYGKTEAFRFANGPIDQMELEILINAWPLDESYIDYTQDDPNSGIINNPTRYPQISSVLLPKLNERGAETNVSTGWHAIEFLLWGQDLNADGPGQRPWTDYTTAPNADRRMTYLVTCTELLRSHLVAVAEEWRPNNYDNHTGEFFLQRPSDIVKAVLKSMKAFAGREIASERLAAALRSESQEDEHSCFSDTTHFDFISNMEGLEAIFIGKYENLKGDTTNGKGIVDIIASADEETADTLKKLFYIAKDRVSEIPFPFDQTIIAGKDSPEHAKVNEAISALWDFVYAIADAEKALSNTTDASI